MAAAPLTAGAASSLQIQSRQEDTTGSIPFPSVQGSGSNDSIAMVTSSEGKERSQELGSPHLATAGSTRIRQRTASDGLLNDLFCHSAAGQDGSISNEGSPVVSPSEGKISPASPFFHREGWAIVGQSHTRHHRRRSSYAMSSHTRGNSSLGAASDLDYFGSGSYASTAPTSFQSISSIRGKDHGRISQVGQECLADQSEIMSSSAHQSTTELNMPDSGRAPDERHMDVAAERAADMVQATERALPNDPPAQSLLVDQDQTSNVSGSPLTSQSSLGPSDAEDLSRVLGTSHNPPRQSVRLSRSDSAPVLFANAPASTVSGASTPVRPAFERSVTQHTPGAETEPVPSYRRSCPSPTRFGLSRPLRSSLTERPSFLKPSFWRRHTPTEIWGARPQGSNSTPASLDERRPSTPSSLRFRRANFRRTISSSSASSSSRRFPEAARALFIRSESRSSEVSSAGPINEVAPHTVSRSQHAQSRAGIPSSARIETAGPLHLHGTRRPTLLRAALSSPLGASTAVTPLYSAGVKQERDQKEDYFGVLPRELQVQIFSTLIENHVSEQDKDAAEGVYRGSRARETEYTGLEAAMRELIKISRVSKSWMTLAFDGQLWTVLKALALPGLSRNGLVKLARGAGSFVREIDGTGMTDMDDANLSALTGHLCGRIAAGHASSGLSSLPMTNLTSISLRGLPRISTSTLNYLLSHSPYLLSARLSDLAAVTNHTCIELARSCPDLQVLDVSRCANVDGEGLDYLQHLKSLQVIKAAGIKHLDPTVLTNLARSLPCLQTLDLSYSDLTDACLAAMTEHEGPAGAEREMDGRAFFELTASQSKTSGNHRQYRAVLPRLKHLAVASTLITDRGLLSLSHGALPHLEVLEVAHNRGIRDSGLIALLTSSPHIRRLDLEGLIEISDKTLKALTHVDEAEDGSSRQRAKQAGPRPGFQLTHLLLSQCRRLHTAAIVALVKACPHLHHLDVDDTSMDDSSALACLQQMSTRARLQQKTATAEEQPPSYCLSLIDCRHLTRPGCNAMLSTNVVRPRLGRRGFRYNPFEYGDSDRTPPTPLLATPPNATGSVTEQIAKMLEDECNEERICVKTFWYWQAIDAKERRLRKKRKEKKTTILGMKKGGSSNDRNGSASRSGSGSSSPLGTNGTEGSNGTESAVRGLSRALLGGGGSSGGSGGGSGYGAGFSRGSRLGSDGRVMPTPGVHHLNGARGHAQAQAAARAQAQAQAQADALALGLDLEEMDNTHQDQAERTSPLLRLSRIAGGLFAFPSPATTPSSDEEEEGAGGEQQQQQQQQLETLDGDEDLRAEGGEGTRGEQQALCVVM